MGGGPAPGPGLGAGRRPSEEVGQRPAVARAEEELLLAQHHADRGGRRDLLEQGGGTPTDRNSPYVLGRTLNPGSSVPNRYDRPSTSNSTAVYAEFSPFWPTFENTTSYDSAWQGSASQSAKARSTKSRAPTEAAAEIGRPRRTCSDRGPRSERPPPPAAHPATPRAVARRTVRAGRGGVMGSGGVARAGRGPPRRSSRTRSRSARPGSRRPGSGRRRRRTGRGPGKASARACRPRRRA